jgi:hypothetical protein
MEAAIRRTLVAIVGLAAALLAVPVVADAAAPLAASSSPAKADTIEICSYDHSRSFNPFATETGDLGYGRLRASLLDPANFGAGGIVPVPVTIRPGVGTATTANLAGCDVFFTSVIAVVPPLSPGEPAALKAAVAAGMVLIADGDINGPQIPISVILGAFGGGRSLGLGGVCDLSTTAAPTGGTIATNDTPVTNGPFGDLRGGTFATTIGAGAIKGASDESVVSCSSDLVRFVIPQGAVAPGSGLVMVGGDGSAEDLFTRPGGTVLYNPNNEKVYLNAIASAVSRPTNLEQCKHGGWRRFGFKNQGQCVVFVIKTRACTFLGRFGHHPKFCPAKLPTQ